MKKIYPFFLFICFSISLFAQQWENPFSDVYQVDSLNVWIVGSNGTIINTKDAGNSWNDYSIDTSLYFRSVCFNTEQNGYILGQDNFNIKTTNGGETWENMELDINFYLSHVFFVDEDHGWISAGDNGLFKTTDGGNSWIHYSDTIGKIIFFDALNGYGKTYNNLSQKLVRTWDGGLTWTEVCGLGNSVFGGGDFHFADTSHGVKIISRESTVHYSKTHDGGQTWIEIDNIYGSVPHFEFLDFQNTWFGYSNFINYSIDFLETYNTFQLPYNNDIYKISVNDYSNGWAVGGDNDWDIGRIWKLVGVNEWVEILPAGIDNKQISKLKFTLYPNPVKDLLHFDSNISHEEISSISIFDNNGQCIKSYNQNEILTHISLVGMIPGTYIIQIKSGNKISTQKIIKI